MDDDIYGDELDWREKEWDEPGPDFGATVMRNRRTGELDILPWEKEL